MFDNLQQAQKFCKENALQMVDFMMIDLDGRCLLYTSCKVIRKITEADSMQFKPEILADNRVISEIGIFEE